MGIFKTKTEKTKIVSENRTLDDLHSSYLMQIDNKKKTIPKKEKKIELLKKKLDKMKLETDDDIILKSKIITDIKNTENEIIKLKSNYEILDYISKAGDLLLTYYNLTNGINYKNVDPANVVDIDTIYKKQKEIQQKKSIIQNRNLEVPKSKKTTKSKIVFEEPKKTILDYLCNNVKKHENEDEKRERELLTNRAVINNQYLVLTDKKYACKNIKHNINVLCKTCNIDKIYISSEGAFVCSNCGDTEYTILETESGLYKEFGEKVKYPYKKINHFKEKLNQLQSRETSDVPEEICNIVKIDLRKNRIPLSKCTQSAIQEILKIRKLPKYYEHVQQIFCRITNKEPIILSKETEETLINMFSACLPAFYKHKPDDRKNFLSYNFVFNKLFRILNMKEYAKYFTLLKSDEKLREQEIIWRKMCVDLGWPIIDDD